MIGWLTRDVVPAIFEHGYYVHVPFLPSEGGGSIHHDPLPEPVESGVEPSFSLRDAFFDALEQIADLDLLAAFESLMRQALAEKRTQLQAAQSIVDMSVRALVEGRR